MFLPREQLLAWEPAKSQKMDLRQGEACLVGFGTLVFVFILLVHSLEKFSLLATNVYVWLCWVWCC